VGGVGAGEMNTSGKKGTSKDTGIPGVYKTVENPNLERTDWDWNIDPHGLRITLRRISNRYDLPILISENGLGAFDKVEEGDVVKDDYRIDFIRTHVKAIQEAISDGVEMIGYCVWSFTDLLSWLTGSKSGMDLFISISTRKENMISAGLKRKAFIGTKT
jgi:6-phospho-beta-glucosidase